MSTTATLPVAAHETDQYTLPVGREFVDLGDHFTVFFYNAIERGVEKTNARIRTNLSSGRSPEQYQTPDAIAQAVCREFPYAIVLIEDLDKQMTAIPAKDRWPGVLPGYKPPPSMKKFLLYPLNPFRAWNCSTLKVHGVYLGTDKIGHFTDMGMHYYQTYRGYLRKGETEEQAMRRAIAVGTSDPIKGESALLGYWTAGAYSNADLVSNYAGLLFYRNLTEPQMLNGTMRPPMLVRDGEYWQIASHVRPDSDFFSWFISEHWDEALNPSHYLAGMRDGMRKMARDNATSVLEMRRDVYGNRLSQEKFRAKSRELRTYFGIDYGHIGNETDLVLISEVCFESEEELASQDLNARDRFGRTALHRAAERGDLHIVRRLLEGGADVNAPVRSDEIQSAEWGNTPLHLAALNGRSDVVDLLIARGAKMDAANDRGARPLHLAVEQPDIMRQLLAAGAKIDAPDVRGRTPLHWAALGSAYEGLALLLDEGADKDRPDRDGQTALHVAALHGHGAITAELLRHGADARRADVLGVTPLHLATTWRGHDAAEALLAAGAPVDAPDALGCTPLHDAARNRAAGIVALLLEGGARPTVADGFGTTPLHVASRQGDATIARMLLDHGADAHVRSHPRGTPLEEARRNGNASLVSLLKADDSRAGAASHRQ